jgi:hypothetical protein
MMFALPKDEGDEAGKAPEAGADHIGGAQAPVHSAVSRLEPEGVERQDDGDDTILLKAAKRQ